LLEQVSLHKDTNNKYYFSLLSNGPIYTMKFLMLHEGYDASK